MDNNAQGSSVGTQTPLQSSSWGQSNATPTAQSASDQTAAADQTAAPAIGPPQKQQVVTPSMRPEHGPVAIVEADEDDKDDRQVAPQEIARQEFPTIQMSQPEMPIAKELERAGVQPGADADRKKIPEEPEQLGDIVEKGKKPSATAIQLGDPMLTMSYGEAKLAAQKERSIRNAISWLIREIIRQWKKRLMPA